MLPPPRTEPQQFAKMLLQIVKEHQISWIIPTCEEVFYVSTFLAQLQEHCSVFTCDLQTLTQLHDKWAFNQFVSTFYPHTPATRLLSSPEEIKNVPYEKFVLKPQFSRFAENIIFADQKSIDGVANQVQNISLDRKWLAQERILGPEVCSMSVCLGGQIMAHSCYRHPFTAGKGAGVSFESFQDDQILQFASKVAQKLNYTGFLSFDFIQDQKSGFYFPLECNPRLTSGIHLFEQGDVRSEQKWFKDQGQVSHCTQPPENRRRYIFLAHVIYGLQQIDSLNKMKLWVLYLFFARDVIFSWTDLRPAFWQFYCYVRLYIQSVRMKISPLALTTHDIEWNGK